MQYFDSGYKTFTAGGAIPVNTRVKFPGANVVVAGASDLSIGTAVTSAAASGDNVAVKLKNAPGTVVAIAAGPIVAGAPLFAAANGKVDDAGSVAEGYACVAAAADGDVFERIQ